MKTEAPKCIIDHHILNDETLSDMKDIALSFFASTCGKNRGAFVLNPPDGKTYGCLNLPATFPKMAGVTEFHKKNVTIPNANAIKEQYVGKNITSSETVQLLDFLVQSVYDSTPNPQASPYACDFNGLTSLQCSESSNEATRSPRTDGQPIRSVTLAGVLADALWATGGKSLSLEERQAWYTAKDFAQMKEFGLNTVQLLVPTAAFQPNDKHGQEEYQLLQQLLKDIASAKLDAILALIGTGDELDAIVAAAKFAAQESTVLGLTLPSETTLDVSTVLAAVRVEAPHLPIFLPMNLGTVGKVLGGLDDQIYGSLSLSHTGTIADIASSESQEDRSKLFYHEATSCIARAPLEYSACFQQLPIFVSSGFDLSIDDCVNKGIVPSFHDYGQCDRFEETIHSGWWQDHRASFAARQLYAYERGLGWSFATWKLYPEEGDDDDDDDDKDWIADPAQLLALKDVAKVGLLPDLSASYPAKDACLNPPENDFVLGDDTLAPTAGPPPDCGNGWWNATTEKCDYWIPPTPAPTAPCPVCEECRASTMHPGTVGFFGLVLGALIGAAAMKFATKGKKNQYELIPN